MIITRVTVIKFMCNAPLFENLNVLQGKEVKTGDRRQKKRKTEDRH